MTKTNNNTNKTRRILAAMLTSLMMLSAATAVSIKSASAATVPQAPAKSIAIIPAQKKIIIPETNKSGRFRRFIKDYRYFREKPEKNLLLRVQIQQTVTRPGRPVRRGEQQNGPVQNGPVRFSGRKKPSALP